MGTLDKSFEELPLIVKLTANTTAQVGMFNGSFEAEAGVVTSIWLDGEGWEFTPLGHYTRKDETVEIKRDHWLWVPLYAALEYRFSNEIAETDDDASQGDDEHRHGKFEALGRR